MVTVQWFKMSSNGRNHGWFTTKTSKYKTWVCFIPDGSHGRKEKHFLLLVQSLKCHVLFASKNRSWWNGKFVFAANQLAKSNEVSWKEPRMLWIHWKKKPLVLLEGCFGAIGSASSGALSTRDAMNRPRATEVFLQKGIHSRLGTNSGVKSLCSIFVFHTYKWKLWDGLIEFTNR